MVIPVAIVVIVGSIIGLAIVRAIRATANRPRQYQRPVIHRRAR